MRKRAVACVLGVLASTLTLSVSPAYAAPSPAKVGQRVTLITGDVVIRDANDLRIEPVKRDRPAGFQQLVKNGDTYVFPTDAVDLIASDKLDKELFNVTGLFRQRYDDAHTDSVPLLVQQPVGLAGARRVGGLELATVTKRKNEPSWRHIADSGKKVWLNAKLSASLDVSVPQVGAPAAWQAGHTGKGVTVAVLDTGIDATHPDVTGKVAVTKDFTESGSPNDVAGHGTHVASTIVSGNARYKGVAPDARLAVGKVLDDDGFGQVDDIIEGMRWAATEVKAKVVNMSLGGGPSDGTDPVSLAVNELSKSHGTLFVIAAGNFGGAQTVATPAAADAALAVGNMTKSGAVADSSSRGPRVGDGAMKPEIAAPGTDIVAARAKDSQGEGTHISYSGTSMAAPHVAGAAAILAGQYPDWTGDAIKSTLVSTAAAVNHHPYLVGAGRLDVARAVTSPLRVSPASVSTNLKWPDTKARKTNVTYHNTGTTPLTLSLALDLKDATGQAAPAALAKLSATTLTIAPGAQAAVTITATPRSGRPGQYGGTLVASTTDGQSARTPVAVQDEAEHYDLQTAVLDRSGNPVQSGRVIIVDLQTIDIHWVVPGQSVRLPPGKYAILADVPGEQRYLARMAHPVVDLKRNTTIKLDARQAKRVSVRTDQPNIRDGVWISSMSTTAATGPNRFGTNWFFDPRFNEVYAYSTPGVTSPQFGYYDSYRLDEPALELFAEAPQRYEVHAIWWGTRPALGTNRRALAYGGQGRPEDLAGVQGKMVVLEGIAEADVEQRIANVEAAGAASVVLNVPIPEEPRTGTFPALFLNPIFGPRFVESAKAGIDATLTLRETGKQRYELAFPSPGKIPASVAYSVRQAELGAVTARYYGQTAEAPPAVGATKLDSPVLQGTHVYSPVQPSTERVEYFTPGKWRLSVFTARDDPRRHELTLGAGAASQVEWNRAALSPVFAGTTTTELGENHPWAFRRGNMIDVSVPFYGDAAGHPAMQDLDFGTAIGSTSLYSGDQLLATQNMPGRGTFRVGSSDDRFRLVSEIDRNQPWWPLSTKISSEWAFAAPFHQGRDFSLPLLTVHAAPPVDLGNKSPSGPVTIPLKVSRQDGAAEVTSVALEFSTDDGATWQQATVSGSSDTWNATVTNPASGFVSLRTKATDTDGNAVTTTVIRAYQT